MISHDCGVSPPSHHGDDEWFLPSHGVTYGGDRWFLPSHGVMPAIKQIKNLLGFDTEDLLDQVDELKNYVDELKDYSWRLTEKETAFLEIALELQKRMVKDAAFIAIAENIADCHSEMEEAMKKRIVVTKERIQVQEEILSLSMSVEDVIDNRIEIWRRSPDL
jgi:hypothetical protein